MVKTLDEIPELAEELYSSVASSIETITFLSVENPDDVENKPEESGEYINGSILIKTAPAMYSMELFVPQQLLENISADITVPGTESEAAGSIVIDVLLELVNTISGCLMRTMEPQTGAYTLEIPEFEIGKPLSSSAFITQKYIADSSFWISVAITKI